jgi:hypothetical protein
MIIRRHGGASHFGKTFTNIAKCPTCNSIDRLYPDGLCCLCHKEAMRKAKLADKKAQAAL